MFTSVVLRRSSSGPALTIGELAEALLYYKNVHLILDFGTLNEFTARLGMPRLLALLARPGVSAVYCEETLGTHTATIGSMEWHSFIAFTFSGDKEVGVLKSRQQRLEFVLRRQGVSGSKARRSAESFRTKVPIRRFSDDYYIKGGILRAAIGDLNDPRFIHEAMRCAVSATIGAPDMLGEFKFEIITGGAGFQIATNLDFAAINARRLALDPSLDKLTPAHLVNEILTARADMGLAAFYGGDFHTSDLSSQIIRLRYGELLRRMGIETQELRELRDVMISGSPTIAEVINRGERTFDEFLALLDKSQRFREWIGGVGPDEKMVSAYVRDITTVGWINSLPVKTLRFALASAVGVVEPITGIAASAADTFLVEKLALGWRPNHFVERALKPFLNKDDELE